MNTKFRLHALNFKVQGPKLRLNALKFTHRNLENQKFKTIEITFVSLKTTTSVRLRRDYHVVVSGAAESECNGLYSRCGSHDGKPMWSKWNLTAQNMKIFWVGHGKSWIIGKGPNKQKI